MQQLECKWIENKCQQRAQYIWEVWLHLRRSVTLLCFLSFEPLTVCEENCGTYGWVSFQLLYFMTGFLLVARWESRPMRMWNRDFYQLSRSNSSVCFQLIMRWNRLLNSNFSFNFECTLQTVNADLIDFFFFSSDGVSKCLRLAETWWAYGRLCPRCCALCNRILWCQPNAAIEITRVPETSYCDQPWWMC